MLTISSGHSASYLTEAVATGRENYYTGAVTAGEPPGRWYGRGAALLGLAGEVDSQDMTALYERFLDPCDPAFRDPSRWEEAATLGHTGRRYLTEEQLYAAALAAEPGADPERRAELRLEAGKKARKNVAFLDATFSVQKSVTVLHTAFEAQEVQAASAAGHARDALASALQSGDTSAVRQHTREVAADEAAEAAWSEHRRAVEDAIWAGNNAALDYLADKSGYARAGHHGGAAGRWVDAHDWTIASFFQHDSRNHDPQLHIHNAILNRVQSADGTWRTVDSRAIHKLRGAASAVGERVMEEHLTRALGVRLATRPDGSAREVVGIEHRVMDLFSSRRHAITAKTRTLVAGFEAQFGRAPNSLELDRLQRSATFATRNAKAHQGETVADRLDRWDSQLRAEVRGGLAQVATDVLNQAPSDPGEVAWSVTDVIETALADVQETKAAWTAPDLTRALSNALPDQLGSLDATQVGQLLDGLTAEALKLAVPLDAGRPGDDSLPDGLRLADGSSAYQAPGGRLYATPEHLDQERLLATATANRHTRALTLSEANSFIAGLAGQGIELGADQAAAVRGILTSGAQVETLVGPAGTGKSFVVGALAKAWQSAHQDDEPRRVVGLAASQVATEVLAGEGLDARNIARWLATQDRLATGTAQGDDQRWRLRSGDLVVVDESAMANTPDLVRIHGRCQEAGAKLLLTGDHHQLAAVGAAGGMDLVAATGARHELTETRRFAQPWEGNASLRLRAQDQTVLAVYHKHGRLLDGGALEQTETAAARAWLADTLAGHHTLLIVDTNEQVARLSAQLRADLVGLGHVDDGRSVPLGLQGTWAGVGDIVQARSNGWHLAGYQGNRRGPLNREQYRVTAVRDDGGIEVIASLGGRDQVEGERIVLPANYVAEHLTLGYASTVHAAQGLTVDTCHTVVTQTTAPGALYVGMTRGRQGNTAHVVTRSVPADAPPGTTIEAVHRSPAAVLAGVFDASGPQRSALAQAVASATDAESVRTPGELFADAAQIATAGRTASWLDHLVAHGHLTPDQRVALAIEDGATTLTGLLRRVELAGHDPQQTLNDAVTQRSLDDARQITSVLHARIADRENLDPVGDTFADWTPTVDDPQWQTYLNTLAEAADHRQNQLGQAAVADPPAWAIEALGPPPTAGHPLERAGWKKHAASVAAYRELVGHEGETDALGPPPKPGQVEAYAAWRTAWRALGRPEADRAEAEMSTGQLRVRIRAYDREKAWAPDYVADQLAGTRQAADKHQQDAALWNAQADANPEHASIAGLRDDAAKSAALAGALEYRARQLIDADQARAAWYAHTAETRAAAERAAAELSTRQAGRLDEPPPVTAQEWLAAHDAEARTEDPLRPITHDHDFTDTAHQRAHDQRVAQADESVADAAGSPPRDIREEAAEKADVTQSSADDRAPDTVRVPTADETAESVRRAQRALHELKQRQAIDARHAEHEVRDEASRRHTEKLGQEMDNDEQDRQREMAAQP